MTDGILTIPVRTRRSVQCRVETTVKSLYVTISPFVNISGFNLMANETVTYRVISVKLNELSNTNVPALQSYCIPKPRHVANVVPKGKIRPRCWENRLRVVSHAKFVFVLNRDTYGERRPPVRRSLNNRCQETARWDICMAPSRRHTSAWRTILARNLVRLICNCGDQQTDHKDSL